MQTPTLRLQINPSRWMMAYCLLVHSLLLTAAGAMAFEGALLLLIAGLVLLHAVYSFRRYCSAGRKDWVSEIKYSNRTWLLSCAGQLTDVRLKRVTVWRWLIVMNFYREDGSHPSTLILWPDSSDREDLRRLRVSLRHMNVWG